MMFQVGFSIDSSVDAEKNKISEKRRVHGLAPVPFEGQVGSTCPPARGT